MSEKTLEQTRIDLGDDLVEKTAILQMPGFNTSENEGESAIPEILSEPLPSNPAEIADELESAKILMGEGLIEEAKKILRRIILADSNHPAARQRLEEIHEIELKQIFGDDSRPTRRQRTDLKNAPDLSKVNAEEIMRQLDQDLRLGVFEENVLGETLGASMSLFQDQQAMKEFGERIDRDMAAMSSSDRTDLGVAFLEMGLYDLANRQFKSASRDPEKNLAAVGLMAYSLILAGRHFEAKLGIEPLLGDTELSNEQKVDFFYLMGRSCEGLKKKAEALHWYTQTRQVDATYRDVQERMRFLSR